MLIGEKTHLGVRARVDHDRQRLVHLEARRIELGPGEMPRDDEHVDEGHVLAQQREQVLDVGVHTAVAE